MISTAGQNNTLWAPNYRWIFKSTDNVTTASTIYSDNYYGHFHEHEPTPVNKPVKHVPFFLNFYRKNREPVPSVPFFVAPGLNRFNRKVLRCNRKGIGLRIKQNN